MDGALFCYSFEQWHKIEERILNLAVKSENMRRFRRIFIGGAFDCPIDRQGRILIPPTLRQYAGLNKEIVLVGVMDHFEIITPITLLCFNTSRKRAGIIRRPFASRL